jgi:hypothetical protein
VTGLLRDGVAHQGLRRWMLVPLDTSSGVFSFH